MHYSQFYADPLRLNPANTGNFNGDYRLGGNLRGQWQSVPVPYQTISAYADMGWLKNKRTDRPVWFGTGLRLLADRAGTGWLSTYEGQVLAAGHVSLHPQLYASLGGAATFGSKQINFDRLLFSSQWNDIEFNPNSASQENFNSDHFGYLDIAVGGQVTYHQLNRMTLSVGASGLHLNQPRITFYDNGENRMGARYTGYVTAAFEQPKLSIEPGIYYTTEKKASEWLVGSNVAFLLAQTGSAYNPQKTRAYTGLWYRWKDALIGTLGLEFSQYRVLASYDFNLSTLRTATHGRGGFELSLVHVGSFKKLNNSSIYCPRF